MGSGLRGATVTRFDKPRKQKLMLTVGKSVDPPSVDAVSDSTPKEAGTEMGWDECTLFISCPNFDEAE